jgi:hypothetical protein
VEIIGIGDFSLICRRKPWGSKKGKFSLEKQGEFTWVNCGYLSTDIFLEMGYVPTNH